MNLQQLIEDIDLLTPNAFSIQQKVGWMNQVQRQLYKELPNEFFVSNEDSNEPGVFVSPPEIPEDNMNFIPHIPADFHELLVLGVSRRIAERSQNFQLAGELEVRFMALLKKAQEHTAPHVKKVKIVRSWI